MVTAVASFNRLASSRKNVDNFSEPRASHIRPLLTRRNNKDHITVRPAWAASLDVSVVSSDRQADQFPKSPSQMNRLHINRRASTASRD